MFNVCYSMSKEKNLQEIFAFLKTVLVMLTIHQPKNCFCMLYCGNWCWLSIITFYFGFRNRFSAVTKIKLNYWNYKLIN